MERISTPKKTRLFVAVMSREPICFESAFTELVKKFGSILIKSPFFDFSFTDYYRDEMGTDLKKIFLGFKRPFDSGSLVEAKLLANRLEKKLSRLEKGQRKRTANLDPGYVDLARVVLASTKDRSQRIYIKDGIYAEVTLLFKGEKCEALPWTYPDYKTRLACQFFRSLRGPLHP